MLFFDIQFVVSSLIYIWLSAKVSQWEAGVQLCGPLFASELFLKRPSWFAFFQIFFFGTAAVSLFDTVWIPWYVGIPALVFSWFYARYRGQTRAFDLYRAFMREGIESAESEESRAFRESQSNLSDTELWSFLSKYRYKR